MKKSEKPTFSDYLLTALVVADFISIIAGQISAFLVITLVLILFISIGALIKVMHSEWYE